jgi:hypothetical protein
MSRPREYDGRVMTSLRLPPELHARLKAAAAERGVSTNLLAERALEAFLARLIPVAEMQWTNPGGHMSTEPSLVAALVEAQKAFPAIKKSKENKHFGSKYADLSDVLAAVVPALNAQGILLTQPVEDGVLVTRLTLGAETMETRLPLNLDVKPQELGSQLSYLRRYSISALLAVASEDDDDGNAASTAKPRRERAAPPVNVDGEPLATKDQQGEFVALCDAQEFDKQDRADFVGNEVQRSAWKDVTKTEAAQLIDALKRDGWETFKDGGGKWNAVRAGAEPWEDVGSGDALTGDGAGAHVDGNERKAGDSAATSPDPAHVAEVVESIEAQVAAAKARRAVQDRVTEVASKGTKP